MARRSRSRRRLGAFPRGYKARGKQPAWRKKFVKQSKKCARARKGSFHACMKKALRGKHA
jgi:hypothetical protein